MSKFTKHFLFIFLLILLIIPVLPLFNNGLPLTHDGRDHVARIANFYLSFTEGNLFPRWGANLNWGYGHPVLMFLYPFSSYLASFFHFIGFSLVDSVKIVFGFGFIASGIFMYLWLSQFLKKDAAVLGAILYAYAPYRFVDLYVRGAVGENSAFIWLPLVLYFIYKLSKNANYFNLIFLSLSIALLILSHNAISLIFFPFILFYASFLWFRQQFTKKYIFLVAIGILTGFFISAFFWFPALIEGKYTLRDILTSGTYIYRFVDFKDLIYGQWSYGQSGEFTVQLGIVHWALLVSSVFACVVMFKKRNNDYILFLGAILYTFLAIFLMVRESNFIWENIMTLQNFQFPWRLLAITVFSTSLLGALTISLLKDKLRTKLVFIILSLLFVLSINYMQPKSYLIKPEAFYSGIFNSTTDTGESSPIWSVRFMEKRANSATEIIEGKGEIKEIVNKFNYREYQYKSEYSSRVLLNILYFPNWTVYIDGKKTQVQFQDPNHRGLITFFVTGGNHTIVAKFEDTTLRKIANGVSIVTILLIFITFVYKIVKKKNN